MESTNEIILNSKKRGTRRWLIAKGQLKMYNNHEITENGWWYEFGNSIADQFETWSNDRKGQGLGVNPLFGSFYNSLTQERRLNIICVKLSNETLKRTVGNTCFHYPESFELAYIKWKSSQNGMGSTLTFEDYYLQLRPDVQALITVIKNNIQ